MAMNQTDFYNKLQQLFKDIVEKNKLEKQELKVTCAVLTAREAIGDPGREDYPIQKGKEKMMQACYGCSYGQAFTDMPDGFSGRLEELTVMPLETNYEKAVFISGLNAVLRELRMADHSIHCKDEDPKKCSLELAEMIGEKFGNPKIALFGLQPAMTEVLANRFEVRVFDLDEDNIGKQKNGVVIECGVCDMQEVEEWADLFLVTGSTICNGSIVNFLNLQKPVVFFGTTIAGTAALLGLNRFCPQSA